MQADSPADRLLRWALETALALVVSLAVLWLWPRLQIARLGREEVWFSICWLVVLAGPAALRSWGLSPRREEVTHTFEAQALSHASFVMAGLFVAFLMAGPELGNYKLWLGVVYLGGITLRLAGLSMILRSEMAVRPARDLKIPLAGTALSTLAGLLIIPWVRPELAAFWPPAWDRLLWPALAALLWGCACGALLLIMRQWMAGQRVAWLAFLAVSLGPGPALAVSWLPAMPLALGFVSLAALAFLLRWSGRSRAQAPPLGPPPPLNLYWLLRALMLFWWGVGVAVALAAAWWQPHLDTLFTQSTWLRALVLGCFLVACVGLLAEYALPLVGRPSLISSGGQRKPLGVILSAVALLLIFTPLLLTRPGGNPQGLEALAAQARADLLDQPIYLSPDNPEVELQAPDWLEGLRHIYVVSLLIHGTAVKQGAVAAQLVATDTSDMPHIFSLRAGIDTAEWALAKREVAVKARHTPARLAQTWIVFSPEGEAFDAHSYYTGLFMGKTVERLKSVRLRYLYKNPPDRAPVKLEIRQIFVY